jgi:CRP/FNR family transcriptional regulator, anaerobic regulatory protein
MFRPVIKLGHRENKLAKAQMGGQIAHGGSTNGQSTPCNLCPLRKRPAFREFTGEELHFVAKFKMAERRERVGTTLLREGENSPHLYTLLSGWAFRYKLLPDGRRQLLNFVLPGGFIGLQSAMLKEMQHSVEALTDVVLCVFPREGLPKLYQTQPGLAFDVTWLAAREENMLEEHLASAGRRNGVERVAYLILHLYNRLRGLGMAQASSFELPATQQHIADLLGLSLVHTNKTLRRLSGLGLIAIHDRVIEIRKEKELVAMSGFDETRITLRPFI